MESKYLESFYTVRFSDCDPFRHLNNARYIDYFLNAREDHIRDHYDLDLSQFYQQGLGWVVMQHEITYQRPANMNEKICIRSGLLAMGTDFLQVEMLMFNEDQTQLKALLHTRFVPVNIKTGRKEPHSPEFMESFQPRVLAGFNEMIPTPLQRVEYWQQQIRTLQNQV